jgi:5-formyltetrahydrofolate cyclo-ligase
LPAQGGVIAGYWPMKGELDPRPLMLKLAAMGYTLALPRMTPMGLDFHRWQKGDLMDAGAFGTQEPCAVSPDATPDLILTPLLAFDDAGGRLGFGKGFYDRAFAALPGARKIGLAYAFQRVEAVPGEAHDVPLDGVIAV